jgi:hypothetical protein
LYIKEENKIKLSKNINIKCSKCIFVKFLLVQTSSNILVETAFRSHPKNKFCCPWSTRGPQSDLHDSEFQMPFSIDCYLSYLFTFLSIYTLISGSRQPLYYVLLFITFHQLWCRFCKFYSLHIYHRKLSFFLIKKDNEIRKGNEIKKDIWIIKVKL